MACSNCGRRTVQSQGVHFGSCIFCWHATLAGFICSWLLMIPLLYVRLPVVSMLLLCLPAVLFTPWLLLHIAGWYRRKKYGGLVPHQRPLSDP